MDWLCFGSNWALEAAEMNREDILQIATESWLTEYGRTLLLRGFDIEINIEELERFAALVAAAERERARGTHD